MKSPLSQSLVRLHCDGAGSAPEVSLSVRPDRIAQTWQPSNIRRAAKSHDHDSRYTTVSALGLLLVTVWIVVTSLCF